MEVLYSWENDAWKIADFGYTVQGSSTAANTDNGRGTGGYRAPEVVTNNTFNNKSDVWSLGCIWFELMCREQAFATDYEVAEFSRAAETKHVPRASNLWNDNMVNLLHRTFEINPANRPSALELIDHFEAAFKNAAKLAKSQVQDPTWEEMFHAEDKGTITIPPSVLIEEPCVVTQVSQVPDNFETRGETGLEDDSESLSLGQQVTSSEEGTNW